MEHKHDIESYLHNIDELWDIITNWEPEYQSIFIKYITGYTIEEIAVVEDCTVDRVVKVIERCKRRLEPV